MSLGSEFSNKVPESTEMLARKVFKRKKNIYLTMGDAVSKLFTNKDFQDLYSKLGQHATNPVIMTLITLIQFVEDLSDNAVMEVIPGRIDLKYLLRLPLEHEGFSPSDLTKFRKRLIEGSVDKKIFERILELAKEMGLVKKENQRTDSTQLLSAVASLSRVELMIEGMRNVVDVLAQLEPDFVLGLVEDFLMLEAYTERGMNFRIPKKDNQQRELAEAVAKDAKFLLEEIDRDPNLSHLKQLRPVVILRRILGEQFDINERGQPRMKEQNELAKSQYLLGSPYDTDARYCTKRSESWLGLKLQVTETCDSRLFPIITDIQVTKSTVSDSEMLPKIQRSLRIKDLKPQEHLVDSGYTSSENIKKSEQYKIKIVGPIQRGNSWQSNEGKGFAGSDFAVNWKERFVVCPAGKRSQKWMQLADRDAIYVAFSAKSCQPCPLKMHCTKSTKGGRCLELKSQSLTEILQKNKQEIESSSFKKKYGQRAGIEGTISRLTNHFGMRRCRYVGIRKAEFQANFAAAALNLIRICAQRMGMAKSPTRVSPFNRLVASKAV